MSNPSPASSSLPIVKKPWQDALGPYYIGLFLWVVFYDQLGLRALQVGGIIWSLLGVVVAGLMCYLLLFRIPAQWGLATGRPLPELAASTFGKAGARWVPGLLLGLAELVWFAVAVSYATDFTLRGLAEVRLVDPRALRPIAAGGLGLKGPLFLATAAFWSIAAGLVGRWFVRLVAAIMLVFPIFPAMALGGSMLAMVGGIYWFAPLGVDPLGMDAVPGGRQGVWSMMLVVQLVFGFFAMAGAYGADWGAASRDERDIKVGGWVAAGLAPIIIGTISLVTVAGHLGRLDAPPPGAEGRAGEGADFWSNPLAFKRQGGLGISSSAIRDAGRAVPEATIRAVMTEGIGGRVGCGMLLIFGISSMAPAVFASSVLSQRLHASLPRISRTRWTYLAIVLSWPLMATGLLDRLEGVFTLMGALFASLVACVSAEATLHKGAWPGPRKGVNLPGMVGWLAGVGVGLLPFVGGRFARFQPAAFWGFVASFLAYWLMAKLVGESTAAEAEPTIEVASACPELVASPSTD